MSNEVNEFDSCFPFLVSQYSSLLFTPECYTVDPTTNVVVLNKNLFKDLKGGEFSLKNSIEVFEQHLIDKLTADLSIRRERRLSSVGQARPRLSSIKRPGEENIASKSKIAKPTSSQSSSS